MRRLKALGVFVGLFLPTALWAQESVELRGSSWVNSKEMSLDRLRGKVVVLYFFSDQ